MLQRQKHQKNMWIHGWVELPSARQYECLRVHALFIWLISIFLQDYTHSDYPITLPLRRPYSGDPGILLVLLVLCCKIIFLQPSIISLLHTSCRDSWWRGVWREFCQQSSGWRINCSRRTWINGNLLSNCYNMSFLVLCFRAKSEFWIYIICNLRLTAWTF